MAQYVYQPLDESNDEIRLVTLLPAADRDSEVICDLNIVRLTDEDVPQYEALSYTWGSAESPCRLRVSSNSDHSIDITENLAEALPYLRDPVSSRVLWIDSIVINQKDLEERGQQIRRMADIYSLAERVIVWLGLDDLDSKTIKETCESLSTKVEIDDEGLRELRNISDQPRDAHWSDVRKQLPYDAATWQAIINFLRRPWFHRLWIWQEIRLAKSNAMIVCGTDAMYWTHLRTLLSCIVYKRTPIPSEIQRPEGAFKLVQNGYNLTSAMRQTLLSLVRKMRHSQCIDPRDRVYGILGLSSKMGLRLDIRPDYKSLTVDVYINLTMYYIQHEKRLDLLRLCQYDESMGKWPSWTPYLTELKDSVMSSYTNGNSACEVSLLHGRVLRVTGMRLGQITRVDSFDASCGGNNTEILRWAKTIDMTSDYVDGRPMAEAFCLTICGGNVSDLYVPPFKMYPSLESLLAFLRDVLSPGDNAAAIHQDDGGSSDHVADMCRQRVFFRTSTNHFGLGPVGAREGDQICVLLGCDAPMLIRADSHGRYKRIGEIYVCGFEYEEAFLGPIPSAFKEVSRYDAESRIYWRNFLHLETGKFQIEDPRLNTELPLGWRRHTDIRGQCWEDFSHECAPDAWTQHDPRLTKSELLKRGVVLEDIELS